MLCVAWFSLPHIDLKDQVVWYEFDMIIISTTSLPESANKNEVFF